MHRGMFFHSSGFSFARGFTLMIELLESLIWVGSGQSLGDMELSMYLAILGSGE